MATGSEAAPAQIALAWLRATAASIPGSTRVARVEESTAADRIVLSPDQLARLNAPSGDRHDQAGMAFIDH